MPLRQREIFLYIYFVNGKIIIKEVIAMRLTFTEQEIQQELNKIYLEEDDLLMEGEWLEGEWRHYIISGVATIEGERYHEFEIEFELLEDPQEQDRKSVV